MRWQIQVGRGGEVRVDFVKRAVLGLDFNITTNYTEFPNEKPSLASLSSIFPVSISESRILNSGS
jgi:hypothetical protein